MVTAKEIMTTEVISVQAETTVTELARILTEKKIGGVPVLSVDNTLMGVVTESDLIDQSKKLHIPTVLTILDSFLYLENPDKMESEIKKMAGTTVADICSKQVTTITPDTKLDEIATIMAEKQIHTLPVLEGKTVIGVVGKQDIIKTLIK